MDQYVVTKCQLVSVVVSHLLLARFLPLLHLLQGSTKQVEITSDMIRTTAELAQIQVTDEEVIDFLLATLFTQCVPFCQTLGYQGRYTGRWLKSYTVARMRSRVEDGVPSLQLDGMF